MDNLNIAQALFNLGRVYGKTAECERALACFTESLRARQDKLGESHAEVMAVPIDTSKQSSENDEGNTRKM
jgi:ABC-type enterochelin transport system substrate-binding protein